MQGKIYYQWQNEFLRRTIYPLREMKLRDFLIAFYEIDLWEKYKVLRLEKLQEEVQEHQRTQSIMRRENYNKFLQLKKYFLRLDVENIYKDKFPDPEPGVLAFLTQLHKIFATYFPKYENTVKERIFLSSRIPEVERERKRYQDELVRVRRNLVNMGESWKHWGRDNDRRMQLENIVLPIIDQEYSNLIDFSNAMAKVENRRQQMLNWVKDKRKTKENITQKLVHASQALPIFEKRYRDRPTPDLEKRISQTKAEIADLTRQQSILEPQLAINEIDLVDQITITPDVTKEDIVRGKIEAYRHELNQKTHEELLELIARRFLENPSRYPVWLQHMVIHFSGMRYQSAHGSWADPREMLAALTEKVLEQEIQQADDMAAEALCREKISIYEGVVSGAFPPKPTSEESIQPPGLALSRKPKWKAAAADHLRRLKHYNLRLKINPLVGQSAVVYEEKNNLILNSGHTIRKGAEVVVEPLPVSQDQPFYRIKAFPENPQWVNLCISTQEAVVVPNQYKRKALLDLRIAEETFRIEEELKEQEVLTELSLMKTRLNLPSWMWHEIVKLTDLRLQTSDANWENRTLTAEEQEQAYSYKYRAYSSLLNQWKQANLTGWREEHDRSHRLIVTRAVCNEVAEHIQQLRGLTPPGGLTAKPSWYRRREKDPALTTSLDKPYFVKAREARNFKPGASLFWLRFVGKEPNAWQVAHPAVLSSGEGLFPNGFQIGKGSAEPGGVRYDPSKVTTILKASSWNYFQIPDGRYKRSRSVTDQNEKSYSEDQWLRWMHEATIIGVFDMIDGPTVLTFETALPDEDRRRSTIGVFRHSLNDLLYKITPQSFTGTFVGYTPEAELPVENLKDMLDWNKILLNPGFASPGQMSVYWSKALGVDLQPSFSASFPDIGPSRSLPIEGEVAPPLQHKKEQHKETIQLFEVDPVKRQAVPYCPELEVLCIELRRGIRLEVQRSQAIAVGQQSYLQVLSCQQEPLAQDFYVLASCVIDAPLGKAGLPAALRAKTPLLTISHSDPNGMPVFVPVKNKAGQEAALDANTTLLLSGVHSISKKDSGSGIVAGADQQQYYLILECPSRPSAHGLFARADHITRITHEDYMSGYLPGSTLALQKICVYPVPAAGKGMLPIFQKSGETFAQVETVKLPSNSEIWVSPSLEFTRSGEYQRIIEFPGSTHQVGKYIRPEDTAPVVKINY
jgi:hypothetical protein